MTVIRNLWPELDTAQAAADAAQAAADAAQADASTGIADAAANAADIAALPTPRLINSDELGKPFLAASYYLAGYGLGGANRTIRYNIVTPITRGSNRMMTLDVKGRVHTRGRLDIDFNGYTWAQTEVHNLGAYDLSQPHETSPEAVVTDLGMEYTVTSEFLVCWFEAGNYYAGFEVTGARWIGLSLAINEGSNDQWATIELTEEGVAYDA